MHRKNFYYATLIVGVTAALTLAITLKLSRSRSATPVPPAADASLLARAATPADDSKGAQKEGIKVHGHWTIDVRNPDGTLVTHREFENALLFIGQLALATLMGRQATTGLWFIMLEPCPVPCIAPWNSKGSGIIAEPNSLFSASPFVSKNLTVSVTPLGG